jgi:hypothetical protein
LVGAVVLGTGIGGSAVAAPIAAAHLGPAGFGLANSRGDVMTPTAFTEWIPAAALAARKPGIDPGGFLGGPADRGLGESAGVAAVDAPSLLGGAAEALLAVLLRLPVHDDAPVRPAAEDFHRLPGGPEGAADALVMVPSRGAGDAAIFQAGADPLVKYAVPALAAASLPAVGLLFFGLVRRHRRAILVRRIKSASARNDLHPARRRSG